MKEKVFDLSNSKSSELSQKKNKFSKTKKPFKKRKKLSKDSYPDKISVNPEQLEKYNAGALEFNPENAKTKVSAKRFEAKRNKFMDRAERTARAEILNKQDEGKIELEDEHTPTFLLTQREICDSVDVASSKKHFSLDLKFGPYKIDYTHNGRHILIGGRKGHVAAFDWMTKDLKNEMNVMESVRDIQWLHVETMYAVAQKRWVRIYDNKGIELHCLKSMPGIRRLEFLPRHFLLVAGGENTCLHYLDVSVGKIVAAFPTGRGSLDVMAQNPTNAIILIGDSRGRVNMFSPNSREPLVEIFTHRSTVRGIAVDPSGIYMATTGLDRRMRIWDLRMYKELFSYDTRNSFYEEIAFSQQRHLAASSGSLVQIFKDSYLGTATSPYLVHRCEGTVANLKFCPYEDILGVGHSEGFSSLIVPGSGEPNFDGLRNNPFESKKQRQEREVKMLLEKIQPDLITLDPSAINRVNKKGLNNTLDYKEKVMRIKPTKITDHF